MSDKKTNIYQKLIELRKQVPFIKKGSKGYNYVYTDETSLLVAIRPAMDELGLILEMDMLKPETTMHSAGTKHTILTEIGFRFTWINADNPTERIEKTIYLQDVAGNPQKLGGLMTYATRYFLTKNLSIPNGSKELEEYEPAEPPQAKDQAISKDQATHIRSMCEKYDHLMEKVQSALGDTPIEQMTPAYYDSFMRYATKYLSGLGGTNEKA